MSNMPDILPTRWNNRQTPQTSPNHAKTKTQNKTRKQTRKHNKNKKQNKPGTPGTHGAQGIPWGHKETQVDHGYTPIHAPSSRDSKF